jgi:hypothetical protein
MKEIGKIGSESTTFDQSSSYGEINFSNSNLKINFR